MREYLLKEDKVKKIDFIEFANGFISQIKTKGTSDNAITVLRSFVDFIGPAIDINEIGLSTIKKYEDYIRSHRKVERVTNIGKPATKLSLKPVTDTGVRDYMSKLKNWYVEAMLHYNDRGRILIPYNPFDKYEPPAANITGVKNLSAVEVLQLINLGDVEVGKYSRVQTTTLARDVAMLSFYLVRMNAVDLYQVDSYKDGRISYNRSKTASRRGDNALKSTFGQLLLME